MKKRSFFSKLGRALLCMILCASIASLSVIPAFAATETVNGEKVLVFNSVDDIAADQINVIVFGDMTQIGADSEGRTIIGGNLSAENWSPCNVAKMNNEVALAVGGNIKITGSINVGGCIAQTAGASISGTHNAENCSSGKTHVHQDTTGWIKAYVNAAEIQFKSTSKSYSQKPANSTANPNWGGVSLGNTGSSSMPYVVNVDGSNGVSFNFDDTYSKLGGKSLIFNISGKNVKINGSNYNGNDKKAFCSSCIWNCYEAETVTVQGSVQGSLLAPYATVNCSGGHINGTAIVNELNGKDGFEYHTGQFFKDPFSAALTVTKEVVGGGNATDSFKFELQQQNGSGWTTIQSFSLKAGESTSFSGLEEKKTFRVVETDSGNGYKLVGVTGGTSNSVADKSATFTVGTSNFKVFFTNEQASGSISISKKLVDALDPNAVFAFTLERNDNGSWTKVADVTLGNEGKYTFNDLPLGRYRISESVNGDVYNVQINGQAGAAAEIELSASNRDPSVAFTNTRKNADITVYKELAEGDVDTGESFSFSIKGPGLDDTFTLKAGDHKSFTGLVGGQYTVTETDSGKNYVLTSDPTGGQPVNLQKAMDLVFVNSVVREGITVKKTVTGNGGNPDDLFTFTIKGSGLNETFQLKAGQSKSFTNLPVGQLYTITETAMDGKYEFVSATGGTANGQSVTVAAASGAVAEFTNKVKVGSIKVVKVYDDKVDPTAKFDFSVTDLSGAPVASFKLGAGEEKVIENLPFGSSYIVSETVSGTTFSTKVAIDGSDNADGTAAQITIGGSHSVTFTNVRKTANISIYKQLAEGDVYTGEKYDFNITGPDINQDFTLEYGEEKNVKTFTGLIGGQYTITETNTGASYVLKSVTCNGSTINNGDAIDVVGDMNLVFTNTLKRGALYVTKQLNDPVTPDASFTFQLQKKVGGVWTDVENAMFSLSNGQSECFSGLEYGYEYRVVEIVDGSLYDTDYKVCTLDNSMEIGGAIASGTGAESSGVTLNSTLKDIVFTNNRKLAKLTVKKTLASGSANLGEKFNVRLDKAENGKWVKAAEEQVLEAGKSVVFVDLPVGIQYRVVETSTGASYTYAGITGATADANVNGGYLTLNGDATVTLTNKIKQGGITVKKILEDPSTLEEDQNREFNFVLSVCDSDVWIQKEAFTLKGGEEKTIEGIPYGTLCKVEEISDPRYTTYCAINEAAAKQANETSSFSANSSATITFKNVRKTASLSVYKELAEGEIDTGESFTFQITGAGLNETFKIKAGDHKTFDGLVGANYTVKETDSGKTYTLTTDPTGGKEVNLQKEMNLTFVNSKLREGITVRKVVNGQGGNADDKFTFSIVGPGLDENFELKAGEAKTFDNLPLGQKYVITETGMSDIYQFVSVTGGTADNANKAVTVETAKGAEVVFTNEVKLGSIKVTKEYNDIVDKDAKFAFTVTDSKGALVDSFALGAGESKTVSNLPFGSTYTVTETVDGKVFSTKIVANGAENDGSAAQITIAGDQELTFVNTRKTANISIYKQLAEGDVYTGEKYEFNIAGPGLNENFTLEYDTGKNVKTFTGLIGGYYTVTETNTGASYTLKSVTCNDKIITNGSAIDVVGDMNLVFTNTLKKGSIFVSKALADAAAPNAKFQIKLQKKVGDAWTDVSGAVASIGNGETAQFKDLEYGYEYRAVETVDADLYATVYNIYNLTESGKNGTAVNSGTGAVSGSVTLTDQAKNIAFTNTRKTANLTVKKALTAGSTNLNEEFTFQLYKDVDGKWVKEGDARTITANGSATYGNLPIGVKYRVVETETGSSYTYDSIVGATAEEKVNGGWLELTENTEVTLYNQVKKGGITVTKTLEDSSKLDEDKNREFSFVLSTYDDTNGWLQKETFTLKGGESKTIDGIPYGTYCKVEEQSDSRYTAYTTVKGGAKTEGFSTAAFTADNSVNVEFTNVRKTAKLTVVKALAKDEIDSGETFEFSIKGANLNETFKLKAGDSKSFTGLLGASYEVKETSTGKTYTLVGDPTGGSPVELKGDTTLTFVNAKQREGLTIKKLVTGEGAKSGDLFTFTISGPGLTDTFQLTAGGTRTYTGLPLGEKYTITETTMGGIYEYVSVTGGTADDANRSVVAEAAKNAEVVFTNKVKTGSLTFTKTLNDVVDPDAKFLFNVYDENNKLVKNATLGADESYTVDGLPYGKSYTVVETVDGKIYDTSISVDGATAVRQSNTAGKVEATTTITGANKIDFTNERAKTKLSVYKQLKAGDVYTGEVYKFNIKGYGLDENFDLEIDPNGGKNVKTFEVYVGGNYTVTETDSGASYTLYSDPTGGQPVNIAEEMKLTYVNSVKRTELTIHKILNDKITPDAAFPVTATIVDAEGKTSTVSGTVSATKDMVVTGIAYGSTVTIAETVDGSVYETKYYVDEDCKTEGNSIVANAPTADLYITNTRKVASATVTKQIAEGDKVNPDEQFTFQLYEANKSTKAYEPVEGKTVVLKAGETGTFENLTVGGKYRIIEITDGTSYTFQEITAGQTATIKDSNGNLCYGADFTLADSGFDTTFINTIRRSGLTVRKIVEGGREFEDHYFHFEIYKNGDKTPLYVNYDASGKPVLSTEGSGSTGFDLAASQSITFTGLELTDTYEVEETTMGERYEFGKVEGGKVDDVNAQKASVEITDDMAELAFTNNVRKGELTVYETLKDDITPDAKFLFTVQSFDGKKWVDLQSFTLGTGESTVVKDLPYGETLRVIQTVDTDKYTVDNGVDGSELEKGYQTQEIVITKPKTDAEYLNTRSIATLNLSKAVEGVMEDDEEFALSITGIFVDEDVENTRTFYFNKSGVNTDKAKAKNTYKIGQNVVLDDLLYGGEYTIEEVGGELYDGRISMNGTIHAGKNQQVIVTENNDLIVTNTRKTGSLSVTKTLEAGSIDLGETYSFKLQRCINGVWEDVDNFDLKADETHEITDLTLGLKYRVIETNTGASYSFASVDTKEELVSTDLGFGAEFELLKDRTVTITNRIKKDGITVFKTVSGDGGNTAEQFEFLLEVNKDGEWTEVKSFKLKAGENLCTEDLDYGYEYRVTEVNSGEYYEFGSVSVKNAGKGDKADNSAKAAYVTLDGAEEIVFNNPVKSANLIVGKKCDATANASDEFTFSLMKKNGSSWTTVETFTLKDGDIKSFGVNYGVEYKIIEQSTGACYRLASITGADGNDLASNSATIKIDGDENVVFNNELLNGSLVVSKKVAGGSGIAGKFGFRLIDTSGNPVSCEQAPTGSFSLGDGDTINLTNIPYGTRLVITETVDSKSFTTSHVIDGVGYNGATTSPITVDSASKTVAYTNTYTGASVLGAADSNIVVPLATREPTSAVTRVLGDTDSPHTGDNVPVELVIAIFVTSLIVLTFTKTKSSSSSRA